jgi:hypothetical protein
MEITENNTYAPIMVMVYDRLNHLKGLVASLLENNLAKDTDFYLISDAHYKEEHQKTIQEVRAYADTITGFKSVTIIKNIDNIGTDKSYQKLMDVIFEKHDRLVFFEDDNLVSPNYLEFMNASLDFYKDYPEVVYVCGYNFPINIDKSYEYDVYFLYSVCAWGYGMWREKVLNVKDLDREEMRRDKRTLSKIKKRSYQLYDILMSDLYKDRYLNDARIGYLMARDNLVSVFPTASLVKNTGHDGTGLHCKENEFFQAQEKDDSFRPKKFPLEIAMNKDIENKMKIYTRTTFRNALRSSLKLVYLHGLKVFQERG